jgi:hypothetical protein
MRCFDKLAKLSGHSPARPEVSKVEPPSPTISLWAHHPEGDRPLARLSGHTKRLATLALRSQSLYLASFTWLSRLPQPTQASIKRLAPAYLRQLMCQNCMPSPSTGTNHTHHSLHPPVSSWKSRLPQRIRASLPDQGTK